MTKQTTEPTQINISPDVLVKARGRARMLGMTLSEYMESLVDQDVATKEHDPWREPVPQEVAEQWSRDIAAFDEEEKVKPHPSAKTADELIQLLDAEAARLSDDDDEGN